MMSPSLSIIIPAYNEAPRLGGSLRTIFAYLAEQSFDSEVIVVDDGSTDDTVRVAEEGFATVGRRTTAHLIRGQLRRRDRLRKGQSGGHSGHAPRARPAL